MINYQLPITNYRRSLALCLCASLFAVVGCTMHPPGEVAERNVARDEALQSAYTQPFEQRQLPELKPDATPEELVRYAQRASGDVEARYWEWRAALEQVPIDGTQKSGLELSLQQMITGGTSALENTTLGIANDAMNSLQLPSKLSSDAQRALHEAQAVGRRFDDARNQLRNQVLQAWYDYALAAEQARLEDANTQLLDMIVQVTESRVATGASSQAELLKAQSEAAMSRNTADGFRGKFPAQRAAINALLNRPADAALNPPAALPVPRVLTADDATLLAAAASNNPELQALAHESLGNKDATARARQEYIPDFNFSFSTDLAGISQSLMSSAVLPYLKHEAIDAGIHQAEANLNRTQALQRQTAHDLAARVVADLTLLREAQRQEDVIEKDLIPRAQRLIEVSRTAYASGNGMMIDLLDSQRSILTLQRMAAEMRIERERQIADLEEVCAGLPT